MPNSEFAHISGSSPIVQMRPSSKLSKTPVIEPKAAKAFHDYDYDSDDEIAAAKAEQALSATSPKSSILSKVKAKLQTEKQPKQKVASSSRTLERNQARSDTIFAFKVLAESRP